MNINPITAIDFYKTDHRRQYPNGTTEVYSNFTPRSAKLANVIRETYDNKIIFFGLQYFIKHFLIDSWNTSFFNKPKHEVIEKYKRRMDTSLGEKIIKTDHLEDLHDLGYLPLKIKALPEGERSPINVPVLTIANTDPSFFWLTNYIETVISSYLWKSCNSASIAYEYKKLFSEYAIATASPEEFCQLQGHDFSFRGMSGIQDAALSGLGHLTSFWGTDTVPAIDLAEDYYHANADEEMIGCSVPATEHSVMCMGTKDGELETFKRFINDLYPDGIVSIVSDTWDFWKVITVHVAKLKDDILSRNGKVVIRPDSGDPIKILAGDPKAPKGTPEHLGAVECLWNIFGGTTTNKGYKVLDQHIGLIYGDSITLERAQAILNQLEKKGFASCNIVFGIGSYTYQYATRDNLGFAMKATSGIVNGLRRDIFKDPKTDSGTKRSAKGLLRVEKEDGTYVLYDQQTEEQEKQGALELVFLNGKLIKETSLSEVRARINSSLKSPKNGEHS